MFDAENGTYILTPTSEYFENLLALKSRYQGDQDGVGVSWSDLTPPATETGDSVVPSASGAPLASAVQVAAELNLCVECFRNKLTVNDLGICHQCRLERW